MTAIAANANPPATTSRPTTTPHAARRPQPSREDAGAMRQAFDRASGKANGGQPPRPGKRAGTRLVRTDRTADGAATRHKGASPLDRHTPEQDDMAVAPRDERRASPRFDDRDQDSHTSTPALATTAQAPVQPVAVPDMPAPHVDPAAFAQLMTQLWLRERGKGTKEVRVTFGDDAWPATGARLVRNAAGTLDIQLHVGDGGVLYEGDTLAGLSNQLSESGLAIGAVGLATGAVA